jgi:hypothetical protein
LEIVVGGGLHAGTYKPPASAVICLRVKQEFSAAFKDFDARAPKMLSEAGISVSNAGEAGAKRGEVRLAFGDPDKKPSVYDVLVPRDSNGPLVLTKSGTRVELSFQGQTKEGIQLRVTASCVQIDEF